MMDGPWWKRRGLFDCRMQRAWQFCGHQRTHCALPKNHSHAPAGIPLQLCIQHERYRLHVTVVSGFLGAGITTLSHHVLNNRNGRRLAFIVNDMSEVNFDADLIRDGTGLSRSNKTLVEMTNGCTLRDDLLIEVKRLAAEGRFDYLTIGWTMAAGSGRVMADLISGRKADIKTDNLGYARFQ